MTHFGGIDLRAQAEVPSALKSDTPRAIRLSALRSPVCIARSSLGQGPQPLASTHGYISSTYTHTCSSFLRLAHCPGAEGRLDVNDGSDDAWWVGPSPHDG